MISMGRFRGTAGGGGGRGAVGRRACAQSGAPPESGLRPHELKFFALALVVAVWALPAAAQNWIGTFEDWSAFEYTQGGGRVCYMSSTPLDMTPKNVNRGDVFMQVGPQHQRQYPKRGQHRRRLHVPGNSVVVAVINNVEFRMFTAGDGAWNPNPQSDGDMVQAMVRGAELVVAGESSRGTQTTDTYSLLGFTAAHRAITEACG